jgi:hypothetical protein
MVFSNNPQSTYNGMMSGQRNMFLLSSVAIAMYGFVSKYKTKTSIFTYLSVLLLVMAAVIGISASCDFEYYLNHVGVLPDCYNITQWRKWKYIGYIYGIFLFVLALYVIASELTTYK